jgi:multidrug efflux pump subunit AcrA (membrane-fusion protein)
VAIPVGAAAFLPGSTGGGPATLPLICCAERKEFTHEILAKGALESAVNVEVKCEVHSRLSSWVRILEVVPEGTYVEPGDFLVRLDSAFLEADFLQQQITCEQSEALMVQARAACEAARFAQKEYLNGEYLLQHQNAQMKLFLAREELR